MIRVIILAKSLTTFENKLSLFPSDLNLREPLHVPKLNDFIASSPARVRDDRFFDQIKEELFWEISQFSPIWEALMFP